MAKVTFSVIKADIGGYVGHTTVHPDVVACCEEQMAQAKKKGTITDYRVMWVGDDINLAMTHFKGENNDAIHKLSWDTFKAGTEVAKRLKLYGAGQDLIVDAFSGNVKGLGPGVAEMSFDERKSEPVLVFMADKCSPGAWNWPLFRMFADPFCTPGLVIDPAMHKGFTFEILDILKNKAIRLNTPEEMYDVLMFLGAHEDYMVTKIFRRTDGDVGASASTQKLSLIAGAYMGKDDPVCIVRCQSGFPAVGEVLEPFAFPHLVAGWTRGSHNGPLLPVTFKYSTPSRFDGPPRVICAGFQLANGMLVGPRDLFDDVAFDQARSYGNEIANYMRTHGPFEPHRLPLQELEYTTMPKVMEALKGRFFDFDSKAPEFKPGRDSDTKPGKKVEKVKAGKKNGKKKDEVEID